MIAAPVASPAAAAATAAATPVPGPQLRDIHLPPAPSWWPPAPGWWLLAALLLLLLLAALWVWRRQRATQRKRQRVLAEVDRIAARYAQDGDAAALAGALHQLLRRVARRQHAPATQQRGAAWQQTLARVPVDAPTLQRLLALEQAIYQPQSTFDPALTLTAVRQWLRLALKPAAWKPLPPESAHA